MNQRPGLRAPQPCLDHCSFPNSPVGLGPSGRSYACLVLSTDRSARFWKRPGGSDVATSKSCMMNRSNGPSSNASIWVGPTSHSSSTENRGTITSSRKTLPLASLLSTKRSPKPCKVDVSFAKKRFNRLRSIKQNPKKVCKTRITGSIPLYFNAKPVGRPTKNFLPRSRVFFPSLARAQGKSRDLPAPINQTGRPDRWPLSESALVQRVCF